MGYIDNDGSSNIGCITKSSDGDVDDNIIKILIAKTSLTLAWQQ